MIDLALVARWIVVGTLALGLAACGGENKPSATPTIEPTRAETAVVGDPTTSATLGANEVTAGQIADRIAAAWSGVTSYRSLTVILPSSGTPEATSVELAGTAERIVVLPDTKRIVIRDQGATTEIVLAGGVLTKRITQPGAEPGGWETIDPATIGDNDPFGRTYETIMAPESPPYSGLSLRQRDRIGTAQETTAINGRDCVGYLFPEVTETGERIQVVVYLGADDLPCRIETRAGMTISQTDYTFNQETEIATPIVVG